MHEKSGEMRQINPVDRIMEVLGVSEQVAQDFTNIAVACPVPGEGRDASLGKFLASAHGADMSDQIIEVVRQEIDTGAEPEQAFARALGFSATQDRETGKLRRVENLPEGSKKK